MPPGTDPSALLQRVLVLERQQGFNDRAAVGGLAMFARAQMERAGPGRQIGLAAAIEALQGYNDRDRHGREAAVAIALHALLTNNARPASHVVSPNQATADAVTQASEHPEADPHRHHQSATPASLAGRGQSQRPKLTVVHRAEELDDQVASLKGMRKATAEALARIGVASVRDLLYYFPRAHYDYTDTRSISRLRVGTKTTLVGTIRDVRNNRTRRNIVITTATIGDDTGTVAVRWFNQPYLLRQLPVGARIAVTGEPDVNGGRITFIPRDYELIKDLELTHAARLVPVYPLTKGLFQRSLRQLIHRVLDEYASVLDDYLPGGVRERLRLPELAESVSQYHFPEDSEHRAWAERRLAFDELLLIQLGLLMRKEQWQQPERDIAIPADELLLERFCSSLPFSLTGAQRRVISEILDDMSRPVPMSRLLQGDVGSGKTVVAAAALLQTVKAGKQGVLMAPTEILAEQHCRTLQMLLEPFDVRCELLIGSTPRAQRKAVLEATADGSTQVLVGTHTLIQEGVELRALGLAITDEQHRFGVEQRALLRQKGLHPHTLAMTATPIPRTLAMTIYGDLDVSSIDEMPPGRMPVITTWSRVASEAYGVVRDEVRKGRQAFVICPVIEESADSDMRSVLAEHRELETMTFSDLNVGLLHGRMKPREKDAALEAFRRGEYHVLVATSVVEVGIDVPNATVMVIRDAHRFGLAQLHQFRGRVGRGGDQAFCVLLSASEGDEARERLEALTATEDGFELAEEDLRLRGPGEFWGTRQSGLPTLRVATLGDLGTIQLARAAAQEMLRDDAELQAPEHELIREQVERFWSETADLS
ncbi:MAG TPA: ATP-dependent DNA helicase RecG [Chloroflexota bacterium]